LWARSRRYEVKETGNGRKREINPSDSVSDIVYETERH